MNGVELNGERERERGGREEDREKEKARERLKKEKMEGKKEGKLIGRETGFNRLKSIFHIYSYSNERQSCNLPYKFPTFTPPLFFPALRIDLKNVWKLVGIFFFFFSYSNLNLNISNYSSFFFFVSRLSFYFTSCNIELLWEWKLIREGDTNSIFDNSIKYLYSPRYYVQKKKKKEKKIEDKNCIRCKSCLQLCFRPRQWIASRSISGLSFDAGSSRNSFNRIKVHRYSVGIFAVFTTALLPFQPNTGGGWLTKLSGRGKTNQGWVTFFSSFSSPFFPRLFSSLSFLFLLFLPTRRKYRVSHLYTDKNHPE